MFILGGEEALAFHLVFGGQFEREYRRGCPAGSCPLDRPLDDGAVANVDAVKKAHGHGTAVCIARAQAARAVNKICIGIIPFTSFSLHKELFHPEHAPGECRQGRETWPCAFRTR